MRRTLSLFSVLIIGTLFATAGIAHAGGWAVVTLDPMTQSPVAGQPLSVGFTILQHGVTPYTTGNAFITVIDASGRSERFDANPFGAPGHHTAEVTFRGEGTYRWEVQPDWFAKQAFGEIDVASAAPITTTAATPTTLVAKPAESTAAIPTTVATTTVTTTTTTTREPLALGLRITLAVAFAVALAVAVGELVTTRRRLA